MKFPFVTVLTLNFFSAVNAQNITLQNLEASFLERNYLLIASKYNIEKKDAEIIQEKLWQNPSLSISEVNLWKTYHIENQPNLIGKYGQNQQIAIELEQLIETAGKRKKRVAIKETEKNNALLEYEELMRELKKELRQNYYSLAVVELTKKNLQETLSLFSQMNQQYKRQADLKNIPKIEAFRIQTELINLEKEVIVVQNQEIELLNKIQLLTHNNDLKIEDLDFSLFHQTDKEIPLDLKSIASQQNIKLKQQKNEIILGEKQLSLEKAMRTPDIAFQINYDRGGNIMRDFVGVGVSMDLPIFNTNKGNIKLAEIQLTQQKSSKDGTLYEINSTIDRLQNQLEKLKYSIHNFSHLNNSEWKEIISNYQKHLQNKQVTLLEFIDFTQAYRASQQAYFETIETYQLTWEELNYIVGKDL